MRKPKPKPGAERVEQWVEVRIVDGVTTTQLYPANDLVKARAAELGEGSTLVYRRLNFPDGVPDEYAWTTSDPVRRQRGGCGTQRMTLSTWLSLIEREGEHIGPTGVGNLPRPADSGECECPVCSPQYDT